MSHKSGLAYVRMHQGHAVKVKRRIFLEMRGNGEGNLNQPITHQTQSEGGGENFRAEGAWPDRKRK